MKKLTLLILIVFLSWNGTAAAQNNGLNGLLLGAGGGALVGQAIGHNSEATLIGTAVGTMFGYMIGNEMDKNKGLQVQAAYRRPYRPPVIKRTVTYYRQVPVQSQNEPVCRETEMLAEIDGQAEKVYGVACLENGNWIFQQDEARTRQTTYLDDDRWEHRQRRVDYRWNKRHHKRHYRRHQVW